MSINHEHLIPVVDQMLRAHQAAARSEDAAIATSVEGSLYCATRAALKAGLLQLAGNQHRADRLEDLLLDDSGEGIAYWLPQLDGEAEELILDATIDGEAETLRVQILRENGEAVLYLDNVEDFEGPTVAIIPLSKRQLTQLITALQGVS